MHRVATALAVLAVVAIAVRTNAQEKPSLLYGKVVSVDAAAGKVVILPKNSAEVTVATDANTTIQVNGKGASLGDVKPDMILRVSPATGTAADLRAFSPPTNSNPSPKPSLLYGKVVSVDAAAGKVVILPKNGAEVTVATDANTKIQVGGKEAALGDVKPDMILRVSPATGTASDLRAFVPQSSK